MVETGALGTKAPYVSDNYHFGPIGAERLLFVHFFVFSGFCCRTCICRGFLGVRFGQSVYTSEVQNQAFALLLLQRIRNREYAK